MSFIMAQKARKNVSLERRNVRLRLLMGLCITLCMAGLYALRPPVLVQVDRHIYDVFLQRSARIDKEQGLVPSPTPGVVDLDEDSLIRYGQWPWPRHLMARLIKTLTESGAAAVGLDILLSEEDRTSPMVLQKTLRDTFGVDVGFTNLPQSLKDNDALLAEIMAQTPVVCGFFLHFNALNAVPLPEDLPPAQGVVEQMPPDSLPPRTHMLYAHGATLPLPSLRAVAPLGSINVAPDPDGVVRAVPLVVQTTDRVHVSLGLRALMRGLGTNTLILRGGPDGLQSVRVGKYDIPVTPEGLLHVPFRGPRHTYPYFSAADILDGKVPVSEIQGRVLIVGTSAPGLLDIRATPLDPVFPGVEVHTAVIDAILSGRFLQVPPWSPGAQMLGIVGAGLMGTLAFALASPLIYLPLTLGLAAGIVSMSWALFARGFFFTPQYVLLTIAALAAALLVVRFWQESSQRRVLRKAFSRYVAPDLVDRISDRGEEILAGERREVTLMFTDIRSFTSISEKLAPEQVVAMLNRYFTPMTALIRSSSGTVDKFIGDAIMAFWNAPLDVPQHEQRGVRCALHMQEALRELNTHLQQEMGIQLAMGVGVHTGGVFVGNMGSAELLDYTCIGDTVNLASRLEGMCPVYGVEVVVSGDCVGRCCGLPGLLAESGDQPLAASATTESTSAQEASGSATAELGPPCMVVMEHMNLAASDVYPEIVFVPLDSIRVKGKHTPVHIYTPLTIEVFTARRDELYAFEEAQGLYTAGRFAEAQHKFTLLQGLTPQSTGGISGAKLYDLYAQRCAALQADPPPQWDGVWTYSKK